MRWKEHRASDHIEDRRELGPIRGAGIGLGGIMLVLAVSVMTGTNPLHILNLLNEVEQAAAPSMSEPM